MKTGEILAFLDELSPFELQESWDNGGLLVGDESGEVERIVDVQKIFSNTLIEETALAANQAVGDFFLERGLPTIYRVHPEKDPEEIAAVAK